MTYSEAAQAIGCAESWLRKHIRELPHHRHGARVRFWPEDVEAIRALGRRNGQPARHAQSS